MDKHELELQLQNLDDKMAEAVWNGRLDLQLELQKQQQAIEKVLGHRDPLL